jgi:hypothetical protein
MTRHEKLDVLFKGLAVAWASVFFIYKLFTGSFAAATSLSLAVTPAKCESKPCGLVTVTLERGENWGTSVKQGELTVVDPDGKRKTYPVDFKYLDRPSFELSPREKTQYGKVVELPVDKPAVIEALFVMHQNWWLPEYDAYVFGSIAVAPTK